MPIFSVQKPARLQKRDMLSDQDLRQMLKSEERLSEEKVDILYAKISALVRQMSGESPPDPDGIERLRSLAGEFETARQTLADATCRWHFFHISRKRAQLV